MIYTARQLEAMLNDAGGVVLPYRARLTPLAQDWARQKKVSIGYADVEAKKLTHGASAAPAAPPKKPFAWYCDGPCGTAKAAITMAGSELP